MRKLTIILSLLLSGIQHADAQKHDNGWLWGIYPRLQDSSLFPFAGNAQGGFVGNTFQSYPKLRNIVYSETNSSFSDAEGNLQFYSNGLYILDTTGNIIENGDSIAFGYDWQQFYASAQSESSGPRIGNDLVFLPHPDNDTVMDGFQIRSDRLSGASAWISSVIRHEIVRREDGHYYVRKKNVLVKDSVANLGGLSACKHGNGRDWWVVFTEAGTNCYYKYLLLPDTLSFVSKHCEGTVSPASDVVVNSMFSQDGSKYIRVNSGAGTEVFDFDRCSGDFSNRKHIQPFFLYDTIQGMRYDYARSGQISPNNRFVYVVLANLVLQYDLSAADVNASIDTVGERDYFVDTLNNLSGGVPMYFKLSQIGTDGKIYIGPMFSRFYSTIDIPDEPGDNCQFNHRSVILPKHSNWTISQFPNYRLGRLPGSACDTVYNSIKPLYAQAPKLNVYPNPAMDEVKLDYNWVEWETVRNVELRITNAMGQVVQVIAVPRYSTVQQVSVGKLAAGVYTVQLNGVQQGKTVQLATVKMSKM